MSERRTPTEEAEAETDAEEAESEWHVWVAVMVVVAGVALIVAPQHLLPELILGLGPVFVVLGVAGWFVQWAIERWG